MKKTILVFGLLILALLLLFQFSKYTLITGDLSIEFLIAIIAIVFFFVGVFINRKSLRTPVNTSKEINYQKIKDLEISNREYEVLQKINNGLSNKEIAEQLHLSESTIKTHVSNLLVKLNAKRRTQAIQIAKAYNIIA